MKAALYQGAGTMVCSEVPGSHPGENEVRIRVGSCGICGTDLHIFLGHMDKRVSIPQSIGHEMSGVIAEVGPGVTGWKPGDRVTVRPLDNCGECPTCKRGFTWICEKLKFLGIDTPGAFAEYWTVPARLLHRIPDNLTLETAALIEPLAVACHDVRRGGVKPGDHVIVSGGGPIGMLIAMVAKMAGGNVTLLEVNPSRLEFARKLGFQAVDARDTSAVAPADVFFEVSGSKPGALAMTALTRPRGTIVVVAIFPEPVPVDLHKYFWKELNVFGARVYEAEDFDRAIALAASGKLPLDKIITKVFPLEQAQEAFSFLASGSGDAMKVLIRISGEEK